MGVMTTWYDWRDRTDSGITTLTTPAGVTRW